MQNNIPTRPNLPVVSQRPRRGCRGCLSRAFIIGLLLLALVVFAGVVAVSTIIYTNFSKEIEDGIAKLDTARDRETFETTQIFDRSGELLWEFFGEGNRTKIPVSQIPQNLISATVAVEDDTFYENPGAD
ncbi:MAG: hypothetical protein GY803_09075, partial [Chloroflexi bacterium]|nr:hypothetical protein [Chloroflexota bacterium]